MSIFYDVDFKDLDIDHLIYLCEVLEEIKMTIKATPLEYTHEEEVALFLEDRFDWRQRLYKELDLLILNVIH